MGTSHGCCRGTSRIASSCCVAALGPLRVLVVDEFALNGLNGLGSGPQVDRDLRCGSLVVDLERGPQLVLAVLVGGGNPLLKATRSGLEPHSLTVSGVPWRVLAVASVALGLG